MKSSCRTRSRANRAVDRISLRSDSICRGACGRCTLTTTSAPFGSVARCTWPIEAAAIGCSSNVRNARLDREPELLLDDPLDVGERERADVVLELAQLRDDVRRHDVGPGRENLTELHERRAELVEHLAQSAPAIRAVGLVARPAPLEQVPEPVPRRDAPDLRDAPQGLRHDKAVPGHFSLRENCLEEALR